MDQPRPIKVKSKITHYKAASKHVCATWTMSQPSHLHENELSIWKIASKQYQLHSLLITIASIGGANIKLHLLNFAPSHPCELTECKIAWWRHQVETFSALMAICAGNSSVTGEFPTQRPVTRSFDVFFDLRLNKRLSKQSWSRWFEMPLCPL